MLCQTRVCAETRAGFLPRNLPRRPRSAAPTLPRAVLAAHFHGTLGCFGKRTSLPEVPQPLEGENGHDDVPVGHRREITEGAHFPQHFPQQFPQHPPSASSPQYLPSARGSGGRCWRKEGRKEGRHESQCWCLWGKAGWGEALGSWTAAPIPPGPAPPRPGLRPSSTTLGQRSTPPGGLLCEERAFLIYLFILLLLFFFTLRLL